MLIPQRCYCILKTLASQASRSSCGLFASIDALTLIDSFIIHSRQPMDSLPGFLAEPQERA
jgi:hypothetical protein